MPSSRRRTQYPLASAVALFTIATADSTRARELPDLRFTIALIGITLGLGALHGIAWQLATALVSRCPRWLGLAVWPLASAAGGAWLAHELGGFSRLNGRYHVLALSVLEGSGAGALFLGLTLATLQPHARSPAGWLRARSRPLLAVGTLVFGATAIAALAAEQRLQARLYPPAHAALFLYALWFAMFACSLWPSTSLDFRATGLLLATIALPMLLLGAQQLEALDNFAIRRWPSMLLSIARTLSDVDRDGASSLFGGNDCAPFDRRRNPLAREIPGNGIDDNCLAGDAKPRTEPHDRPLRAAAPSPVDVVLVTVDSLRADHVGVYNPAYRRPQRLTTPNLDRWAEHATVFRNAFTPGGWTSVALPSLMHGRFPRRLRWTYFYETTFYEMIRKPFDSKLRAGEKPERIYPLAFDDPHPPLAERLRRRGMRTLASVDDGYSKIFQRLNGASTGFETYFQIDDEPQALRGDQGVVDLALASLNAIPPTQRYFMWVHLFGVHGPDEYHPGAKIFGPSEVDLYDHEISSMDIELARLLEAIERRPAPVAIFISADHGEELDSLPRNHGFSLNDVLLRVPLIAKVPGWPARSVDEPASLVDIVPTILALTRTASVPLFDGRDLSPSALGSPQPYRVLFSDSWHLDADAHKVVEFVAAYDAKNKLVYDRVRDIKSVPDRARRARGLDWPALRRLSQRIDEYIDSNGGDLDTRE